MLTVTQNIILGKPITKKNGLIDNKKAETLVEELGEKVQAGSFAKGTGEGFVG